MKIFVAYGITVSLPGAHRINGQTPKFSREVFLVSFFHDENNFSQKLSYEPKPKSVSQKFSTGFILDFHGVVNHIRSEAIIAERKMENSWPFWIREFFPGRANDTRFLLNS